MGGATVPMQVSNPKNRQAKMGPAADKDDKRSQNRGSRNDNPLAALQSDVHKSISFSHNYFCAALRQTSLYIKDNAA